MKKMCVANIENSFLIKGKDYSFLNPYSMLKVLKRPDLMSGIVFGFDGAVLCLIFSIFLKDKIKRISFDNTSLAPIVFRNAELNGLVLSIVGGSEEENNSFLKKMKKEYPNLIFGYCASGYFDDSKKAKIFQEISTSDIVVCSMGAVLQDEFIQGLRGTGYKGTSYTCGGFVRQYSSSHRELYYPDLINKYNLRFIYRMYKEPHTVKRYMFIYPYSILKVFFMLLRRDLEIQVE